LVGARKGLSLHKKIKGMQETGRNYESSNFQQRPSGEHVQESGSYVPVLEERSPDSVVSLRGRMEHKRRSHKAFYSCESEKPESRVQRPYRPEV
jgi:hypothetical protein